jgi:dTDP-4-dehydrorhamnose reductase
MRADGADSGRLALLVPGGHGQLGSDLATLGARFGTVRAPGSAELDITDAAAISRALDELLAAEGAPVVCNAAAYTAVDAAESDVDRAYAVNATGPELLATACVARDIPLLQVSTDYVFPGDADHPYEPDDVTGPHTVYGRTKLAGEQAVLAAGPQLRQDHGSAVPRTT